MSILKIFVTKFFATIQKINFYSSQIPGRRYNEVYTIKRKAITFHPCPTEWAYRGRARLVIIMDDSAHSHSIIHTFTDISLD